MQFTGRFMRVSTLPAVPCRAPQLLLPPPTQRGPRARLAPDSRHVSGGHPEVDAELFGAQLAYEQRERHVAERGVARQGGVQVVDVRGVVALAVLKAAAEGAPAAASGAASATSGAEGWVGLSPGKARQGSEGRVWDVVSRATQRGVPFHERRA